jgi:hypothetical protein
MNRRGPFGGNPVEVLKCSIRKISKKGELPLGEVEVA